MSPRELLIMSLRDQMLTTICFWFEKHDWMSTKYRTHAHTYSTLQIEGAMWKGIISQGRKKKTKQETPAKFSA